MGFCGFFGQIVLNICVFNVKINQILKTKECTMLSFLKLGQWVKFLLAWGMSLLMPSIQAKEIYTITVPNILLNHAVSNVPTKEPLDFRNNTIASLFAVTDNLTLLFQLFTTVVGVMLLLSSLFQYLQYRQNASATRFSQVASSFLGGVILLIVSYLATL
jgi:hypothetical protein